MMKQLKHILLASLALAFLTLSCIDPLEPMPKGLDARLPDKALVFSPSILGSTVVTKAINTGVDELGELAIETLDVYVYKVNDLTKPFKRYHFITKMPEDVSTLPDGVTLLAAAALASGTDIVLETDWRQAGYDQTGTQKYRIYSIANSRMAHSDRWVDMSEETLKKKTITSAETHYGSYDIVRPKDGVGPGDDYYNIHIEDKNFLMDGMIDEWTITVNESQQYFTLNEEKSFPLTRAAAKFIVNVSFDPVFLTELAEEGTVIERHDEGSGVFSTTGAPRFKFANFMPVTYEVTPANIPSGDWRDGNLWSSRYNYDFPDHTYPNPNYDPENPDAEPQTLSGDLSNDPAEPNYTGKATYTLTTYSYSFAWDGTSEGAVNAPALVLRVNYKTGDDPAETFFYRVPLVDLTKISSIKRNYLYVVDATISSKGAIIEDIVPMNVDLRYKVIPWPAGIRPEDVTEVEGANLLYFTADTTYTLRGENVQSTKLEYFTPKSVKGTSGHYEYEPKISNIRVYFVPAAGDTTDMMKVANPTNQYSWEGSNSSYSGSRVVITVSPNKDGGGTVDISSNVLASRAVKHIEFDATVTFTVTDPDTGVSTTSTVTHHYFIKHFPLDNIQSVLGAWSSRWNGVSSGEQTTYFRRKFSRNIESPVAISQLDWWIGIGNINSERMSANSEENQINGYFATGEQRTTTRSSNNQNSSPVAPPTSIQWSYGTNYWGTTINSNTVTITGTSPNGNQQRTFTINYARDYNYDNYEYDYYDYVSNYTTSGTGNQMRGTATLVKYENYYHIESTTQYTYNPSEWGGTDYPSVWEECKEDEYYESISINPDYGKYETSSTEPGVATDWVNWAEHTGSTYRDLEYYAQGGWAYRYNAKYWGGYYTQGDDHGYGRNHVFSMTGNNSGSLTNYSTSWDFDPDDDLLSNNHMYVIQISKAENGVVLGRPRQNDNHMSNDNVVSPAFMIASQLGAVGTFDSGANAATHCSTYLEVTKDGRLFANWRLPTAAEIAYIVGYQTNTNITSSGVFEPVITGVSYYTLDGQLTETQLSGASGTNRVRCVRDLTPAEVEELNRTGVITDATY